MTDQAPPPPPLPAAPAVESAAAPTGPGLDPWDAPANPSAPAPEPPLGAPATVATVADTPDSNASITERVLTKLKVDPRTGELAPAILVMVEQLAPLFAVKAEDAVDGAAGRLDMDDVLIAMHDAVRDVRLEDDQAAVAAHHEATGAAPFDGPTVPNPS
jgi:hypothetical protein